MTITRRILAVTLFTVVLIGELPSPVLATPQFARQYRLDCSSCHIAPPKLNQRGEDFLARGYRFARENTRLPLDRTVPLAVWNTLDVEHRQTGDLTKAFLSRIELISSGAIGRTSASYFVEWRAVSNAIGPRNRLLNRSGRFEDAFVNIPLPVKAPHSLTLMAGQFRALHQVDVSRRLSLSEPLAFSAGVPDRRAASPARLTNLRAFSPSGRQPALRLAYQTRSGTHVADGWYSSVTLPLAGEWTIPLTDAASFEFEARPKGVFLESYYRRGLTSLGGHMFLGDQRRMANLVAVSDIGQKLFLTAAIGVGHARAVTDTRYSLIAEYAFNQYGVLGVEADHRTRQRRAILLFANGHMPFGPPGFRQAFRAQFEQRLQRDGYRSTIALSHIF